MKVSHIAVQNDYDFVVTEIGHVLKRSPNETWQIHNVVNTDYHVLGFAIEGSATYHLSNEKYNVKRGDVLFFPKGMAHSASSNVSNPWAFYSVSFDVKFFNKPDNPVLLGIDNIMAPLEYSQLCALFSEINHMWSGKSMGYLLMCRSLIMQILYIILKTKNNSLYKTPHYQGITKVMEMIQENYSTNYSIEYLANSTHLSYSHFSSLFKKLSGHSVTEYQNQIKIYKAKDLLLSGNFNVSEAAEMIGFSDLYYFSRLFKKITGVKPSDFLKK